MTFFKFRNVILTLETLTQKRLGTVQTRFYIVEMFETNVQQSLCLLAITAEAPD